MKEFYIEKKIYYHDTDCGGVVYYANYLKFLEEGRTEYCSDKGISLEDWMEQGVVFPVVHVELDYKSPARYQDVIKIYTRVDKIGKSSVHFGQEIKKDNITLVQAKTVWACVGGDFKPRGVPEEIRQALAS